MNDSKKIALPIIVGCLVLVAIGVVVGWILHNNPNEDSTSTNQRIHCAVCGDENNRSPFYQSVFTEYLQRTNEKEKEIEYGHRCENNLHEGIDCGTDGICWTIKYLPHNEPRPEIKIGLKAFTEDPVGEWRIHGESRGCLVNAHNHKFKGEELLSDAIKKEPENHLTQIIFQNETERIKIHFCKSENCNKR